MTFYFWSPIRRGFVVVCHDVVQSTSYASRELLKEDWPDATPV